MVKRQRHYVLQSVPNVWRWRRRLPFYRRDGTPRTTFFLLFSVLGRRFTGFILFAFPFPFTNNRLISPRASHRNGTRNRLENVVLACHFRRRFITSRNNTTTRHFCDPFAPRLYSPIIRLPRRSRVFSTHLRGYDNNFRSKFRFLFSKIKGTRAFALKPT